MYRITPGGNLTYWRVWAGVVCLIAVAVWYLGAQPAKYFDPNRRIPWTTTHLKSTPEPPAPYRLERVFPKLRFKEPVYLVAEPGSNRLIVVERKGNILRFVNDPTTAKSESFLKLGHEAYSLTFHPDYAKNGVIFVFRNFQKDGKCWKNRISRFRTSLDEARRCDVKSEEVLLEWISRGHNGGDMAFGPDGMLYITAGDGETGVDDPDPSQTGQDLSDLRGSILRIDVNKKDPGKPYAIPRDNPFLHLKKARRELWAFGLRNPWRFSFDRKTGRMWIGDNGEETWESIYIGKRGGNYGWSVLEGSHPFNLARQPAPVPFEQPVAEHPHSESRSIMGGLVYRGNRLKELQGVYIYGDHETGKIWGLRWDGNRVQWHKELADTKRKIISFGEGLQGELYVVTFSGELFRLVLAPEAKDVSKFPRMLSETGLFASVRDHQPAAGLVPYSVNAPAWSDGAEVDRYIALPGVSRIKYQAQRGWEFPNGAVLMQTFALPQAKQSRRIETRLLHRHNGTWFGYSYRWNTDQTDAELVKKEGETHRYKMGANASTQSWHFPSRAQCFVCHSYWGPRFVIGASTVQMNRTHDYGGLRANQIEVLARLKIFENPPKKKPAELPRLVAPRDATAGLAARARSYLHANCAHCHRYSGTGNSRMRLVFDKTGKELRIIDVAPEHGGFGLTDARLIAPGHPEQSVIYYRMAKLGRGRMPHLGSQAIDPAGLALIHHWIEKLPSKQLAPDPGLLAHLKALEKTPGDDKRRHAAIDGLLASSSGALLLVHALDHQSLAMTVRKDAIARGTTHANRNIRDLFERFLPEERRSKRLGDAIKPEQILSRNGNVAQGQHLFLTAPALQCKSCHQVGKEGQNVGPDLTRLANRYTRAQLLESLLQPSKLVDPKFQAYVAATTNGQVYSGLLVKKSPKEVILKDARNNLVRLASAEVEALQQQTRSLMPDGLLRDLTAQEAADLLEYLYSINKGPAKSP